MVQSLPIRGNFVESFAQIFRQTNRTGEHVSYVTTLWPLMALETHIDSTGRVQDQLYPLKVLASGGVVQAHSWEARDMEERAKNSTKSTVRSAHLLDRLLSLDSAWGTAGAPAV